MRRASRGFTLVEVMVGFLLLTLALTVAVTGFVYLSRQGVRAKDKVFATQKAMQMMEELRAVAANAGNTSLAELDVYDDNDVYNPVLTTAASLTAADPTSGNAAGRFVRLIDVRKLAGNSKDRQIHVRVFLNAGKEPLAEVMSAIRNYDVKYPSTHVYDLYVIAINNVPGWWTALSSMKPMFHNVLKDIESRNPGLQFRVRWITKLAWAGRDPFYAPHINLSQNTEASGVFPWVYLYPGLAYSNMLNENVLYYDPALFTDHRVRVDGALQNPGAPAVADQYNNAVRYPEEKALYDDAVADANAAGREPPEPSLRMLIEEMNSEPNKYRNAMLVNLHGQMQPVLPIRNYSDAAKDPGNNPTVFARAVTHPENLHYAIVPDPSNPSTWVRLRVYSYAMNPGVAANEQRDVTVEVGESLSPGDYEIVECYVDAGSNHQWRPADPANIQVTPLLGRTQFLLKNSPLGHAPRGGTGGLNSANRLYGLEYIPSLVQGGSFEDRDLTTGGTGPKNTARWVIRLKRLPAGRVFVRTWLGNQPAGNYPNLSKTYVWVAQDPPLTERYQFMGDPRHMPYADVKTEERYNWYFRRILSQADGYQFPRAAAQDMWFRSGAWTDDWMNIDVPRYTQLFRDALLKTTGLWSSMSHEFYYVGLGGEIGADAENNFDPAMRFRSTPWEPTSNSVRRINEIVNSYVPSLAELIHTRLIARHNPPPGQSWASMPWLGEIYPDYAFISGWRVNGNLPTGSGNYFRAEYSGDGDVDPVFGNDRFTNQFPSKTPHEFGQSSFVNGNPGRNAASHWAHVDAAYAHYPAATPVNQMQSVPTLTGRFALMGANYPVNNTVRTRSPFILNNDEQFPPEWNVDIYEAQRTETRLEHRFYDSQLNAPGKGYVNTIGAGLVSLIGRPIGSAVDMTGYLSVNGFDTQSQVAAAPISKLSLAFLVRSFLTQGKPSVAAGRVTQLPQTLITAPDAQTEISLSAGPVSVAWEAAMLRWDGQPYTEEYTAPVAPPPLIFHVKYSADDGVTWRFAQTGALTLAGQRSANAGLRVTGAASGNTVTASYSWSVSGLAPGGYILRVESFRRDILTHFGTHQVRVFLKN